MCLAVPGQVLDVDVRDGHRTGRVQIGGIVREAYLDFVPEAAVGDFVLVHVGFAIGRVDAEEAASTFAALRAMGLLEAELPPADAGGT
jgi:hydrogenase expression/formation protein HypC